MLVGMILSKIASEGKNQIRELGRNGTSKKILHMGKGNEPILFSRIEQRSILSYDTVVKKKLDL